MTDELIAAALAQEIYGNEALAPVPTWVQEPSPHTDLTMFGIDGDVDLIAIVAFVRGKLQ